MMNKLWKVYTIFLFEIFLKYVSSQTIYNCSPNATCGCSANSAILTKIVGGENAASDTWGWAASLRYTSTNSHFCGGSIISPSHILTAAHCTIGLSSPSEVTVYVGSIYLSVTGQVRSVSNIYIYPTYSSTTYVNDLSILKLSSPIDFSQSGVNIICLPDIPSSILATEEYPPPNTNVMLKCSFVN
jgi:secreted trypsin-like serine protease